MSSEGARLCRPNEPLARRHKPGAIVGELRWSPLLECRLHRRNEPLTYPHALMLTATAATAAAATAAIAAAAATAAAVAAITTAAAGIVAAAGIAAGIVDVRGGAKGEAAEGGAVRRRELAQRADDGHLAPGLGVGLGLGLELGQALSQRIDPRAAR